MTCPRSLSQSRPSPDQHQAGHDGVHFLTNKVFLKPQLSKNWSKNGLNCHLLQDLY